MLRSWSLSLQLEKPSGLSLYIQIAQKIIDEIQQGRFPPGTVMPGTRRLAESLSVNRKTVVLAYEELIAQGWLMTENRRGTFVPDHLPNYMPAAKRQGQHIEDVIALSSASNHTNIAIEQPPRVDGVIDFRDGMPDTRLIPFEAFSRAFRRSLVSTTRTTQLKHENPKESVGLRASIASMLNMEKGLHVCAGNVCVVRGSQMGIFITARTLTKPGDYVVFESLSYTAARQAFKSCGANILHAGIDDYGIDVDEIESLCKSFPVRVVFVTPQHQFPTTVTLVAERKKKLLKLAELYDFMIVEDDHEFHFSSNSVMPLVSADKSEKVIYIGSFSQMLAPGLCLGYLVGPSAFIDKCAAEVELIDRQGNRAIELAIADLMHSGEMQRHISRMTKIYNERRELLRDLIQDELSPWVDLKLPQGGLAFWLRFRNNINMKNLITQAFSEKVCFSPGSLFSESNEDIHAIRLGFASLNAKELTDGIQRLKKALLTIN